jgi:hypothetical protein
VTSLTQDNIDFHYLDNSPKGVILQINLSSLNETVLERMVVPELGGQEPKKMDLDIPIVFPEEDPLLTPIENLSHYMRFTEIRLINLLGRFVERLADHDDTDADQLIKSRDGDDIRLSHRVSLENWTLVSHQARVFCRSGDISFRKELANDDGNRDVVEVTWNPLTFTKSGQVFVLDPLTLDEGDVEQIELPQMMATTEQVLADLATAMDDRENGKAKIAHRVARILAIGSEIDQLWEPIPEE